MQKSNEDLSNRNSSVKRRNDSSQVYAMSAGPAHPSEANPTIMNNINNYENFNQNISIKIAGPKRTGENGNKRYVKAVIKGSKAGKSGPGKYTERNASLVKEQAPVFKGNQSQQIGSKRVVNLSRDEYDII